MSYPTITSLPDAPQRGEAPETFSTKANSWVAAIDGWTDEVNDAGAFIETSTATVSGIKDDVVLIKDDIDVIYENMSGATNFKGSWSTLTGALNVPASVEHNGKVWQLLVNLPNVTLSEPASDNADWLVTASGIEIIEVTTTSTVYPTGETRYVCKNTGNIVLTIDASGCADGVQVEVFNASIYIVTANNELVYGIGSFVLFGAKDGVLVYKTIKTEKTILQAKLLAIPEFPSYNQAVQYGFWNTRVVRTTTGSFTVPAGVTMIGIVCIGAGANAIVNSFGGSSGGLAAKVRACTPGEIIDYTISSGIASCEGMSATAGSGSVTPGTGSGGTWNRAGGSSSADGGGAGVSGTSNSGAGGGGFRWGFISLTPSTNATGTATAGGGMAGDAFNSQGGSYRTIAGNNQTAHLCANVAWLASQPMGIIVTSDWTGRPASAIGGVLPTLQGEWGCGATGGSSGTSGAGGFGGGGYGGGNGGFGGGGGYGGGNGGFGGGGGRGTTSVGSGGNGGFGGGGGSCNTSYGPGLGGAAVVVFVY